VSDIAAVFLFAEFLRPSEATMRTISGLTIIMMSVVAGAAKADSSRQDDDAAVRASVRNALEFWKSSKWAELARNTHPAALERFKAGWSATLIKWKDYPTLEAILGPQKNLDQVLKMAPEEFYRHFLEWTAKGSFMLADYRNSEGKVIGIVFEKDDLAHAVVRFREQKSGNEVLRIVSVRKEGNQWRLLLPGEVEALVSQEKLRSK
jgi:hypothetical protein